MMFSKLVRAFPIAILFTLAGATAALAQDDPTTAELAYAIDNLTLFICGVLVLFMQAGFAMLAAGFNSSKNTVNILFKNLIDLSIGGLLYYVVGYGLMYGNDLTDGQGIFGWGGVGIGEGDAAGAGVLAPQVDFFFQAAFAAAAATIVAGAVSGRMQFRAYLVYSAILTGLIYPISGYWKWGGGWLHQMGFHDFAGSIVVHSVGGFAALAGAIILGPRIGRFNKDGSSNPMPGHNITMATLGVFILLVCWFGFNPGSQLAFTGQANTDATMLIATNTLLAACSGAIMAMFISFFVVGKADLAFALNGMLGGLVGVTANCDSVVNWQAIVIGAVGGIVVIAAMYLLEALRIDDPVGAWPVHGACGIWGGLATGIFGGHPIVAQLIGSVVVPIWAFVTMFVVFYLMQLAGILRVSAEEEIEGLDITEHGVINYPEFGASVVGSSTTGQRMMPDMPISQQTAQC